VRECALNVISFFRSHPAQVIEGKLPRDFEYHKVPAPWIQIKLLRILRLLGADDQRSALRGLSGVPSISPPYVTEISLLVLFLSLSLSRMHTHKHSTSECMYEVIRDCLRRADFQSGAAYGREPPSVASVVFFPFLFSLSASKISECAETICA
jgi:hypothetical protein